MGRITKIVAGLMLFCAVVCLAPETSLAGMRESQYPYRTGNIFGGRGSRSFGWGGGQIYGTQGRRIQGTYSGFGDSSSFWKKLTRGNAGNASGRTKSKGNSTGWASSLD